jgi:predicted NBD/HSP70 family sugar kinase
MEHYAGIDVSLERSSVCVVDATGQILREAKWFIRQVAPFQSCPKLEEP